MLQEYEIRHFPGCNIRNVYVIEEQRYDSSDRPLSKELVAKLGLINKIKYHEFRLALIKQIGDYGHGYIEIRPNNSFSAFNKDGTPLPLIS
jgi:hypothetical protein